MASLMLVNPRKRKAGRPKKRRAKARSKTRVITRYRTRKPKKRVRRRRNPIKMAGLQKTIITAAKDGAIGSVGAIAGSVVGNLLPLPETLKSGNMGLIVQALVGIGTGVLVGNFTNRRVGENMAQGAVTVALHSTMKNLIQNAVPALDLGGYDEGLLGSYDEGLLGQYDDNLGYSGAGLTNPLDDSGDFGEYDTLNEYEDTGLDY